MQVRFYPKRRLSPKLPPQAGASSRPLDGPLRECVSAAQPFVALNRMKTQSHVRGGAAIDRSRPPNPQFSCKRGSPNGPVCKTSK